MDSLAVCNAYVPREYDLTLEIRPDKHNFTGSLEFVLDENLRYTGASTEMVLNAEKLVVLLASVDGSKVEVISDTSKQQIRLQLPQNCAGATVQIKYIGTIKTLNSFEQTKGVFKFQIDERVVILTQSQPLFARMIYPCVDDPAVKVPMKLRVTTAKELKVVSNNAVEKQLEDGDVQKVEFFQTPPMLSSNFALTIGDLQYLESATSPIRVYCLAEFVPKALFVLEVAEKLFPMFEARFGPYPLKKLDVIGIPFLTEGAMENWGAITVMQDHLFKDDKLQTEQLIAHELVHQWIGNLVSFEDWKYLWLNESIATLFGNYFVSLIDKHYSMTEEFIEMSSRALKSGDVSIQKFMNRLVITNEISTSYLFNHQVYEKGILMLRMIARILSPGNSDDFEPFIAAFKSLIEKFKYKSIKASDIWLFFMSEYDIDLITFVSMWIRYDKVPSVQITHKDGELILEQAQSKPYQFPLIVKTTTKSYQILVTEKTTKIKVPALEIVAINQNRVALAKQDISKKLIKETDVDKLTRHDALSLLIDYPDSNSGLHQKLQSIVYRTNRA